MTARALLPGLLLLLAACGPADPSATENLPVDGGSPAPEAGLPPETPFEATTGVYRCPGEEAVTIVTRTVPHGLGVFLPPTFSGDAYQVLTEAASGAFANETLSLQRGEREISLQSGALTLGPCPLDHRASIWEHAKLNGVDFRATGNEPGWVLEIRHGESIDLRYDYGAGQLALPVLDERSDPEGRETRILAGEGDQQVVVLLRGETCQDTMADEQYETRVVIAFAGRRLQGCGQALH